MLEVIEVKKALQLGEITTINSATQSVDRIMEEATKHNQFVVEWVLAIDSQKHRNIAQEVLNQIKGYIFWNYPFVRRVRTMVMEGKNA